MKRRSCLRVVFIACCFCGVLAAQTRARSNDDAVRKVILQFEDGVKNRDLARIEPLMAANLVALENGHRNDGWAAFRDHHLVPEMKEPAPETTTELMRLSADRNMAWAYTKSEMQVAGKDRCRPGREVLSV